MNSKEFERKAEAVQSHLYIIKRGSKTKIQTHKLKVAIIAEALKDARNQGAIEGFEQAEAKLEMAKRTLETADNMFDCIIADGMDCPACNGVMFAQKGKVRTKQAIESLKTKDKE